MKDDGDMCKLELEGLVRESWQRGTVERFGTGNQMVYTNGERL